MASSVQLDGGQWWVTGGTVELRGLKSSRLYQDGEFVLGPMLPQEVFAHCTVRVNETHTFLAGGDYSPHDVFMYNWATEEWTQLEGTEQGQREVALK